MPAWGGTTAVWSGTGVIWAYYGPVAPASPGALLGERAPLMLDYLPTYEHASTFIRAVIQAEGYELDAIWAYARVFSSVVLPDSCPPWALPMWESVLRTADRSAWTDAQRRAAIDARLTPAVTATALRSYLAAEARTVVGNITITVVGFAMTIATTGLTTDQKTLLTDAARLAIGAHMTLTVT